MDDEILDRVFGKQDAQERVDLNLGEVRIRGIRLDTLSTDGLLSVLARISAEAEAAKKDWHEARRARLLAAMYAWGWREDIDREDLTGALGVSSTTLSKMISEAKVHIRRSEEIGKTFPTGGTLADVPAQRSAPPWAMGTLLENAFVDWMVFGE